ncbi:hypothetical protein OM226_09460 [Escherichia albertii]|nr:hypothetical protein [Escherichia albertii]MCZ8849085.1 hypothetical protein [Escherichia albertii]
MAMKWLWQIYIILFFLFIQFIIAGFSSCFIDLTEANTAALLLTPGTISLLFFLLPFENLRGLYRICAAIASVALTVTFNYWHLVDGNKELVLVAQLALFIGCMAYASERYKKRLVLSSLLLAALCIAGVLRQVWLERQFYQVNICIVNKAGGCGASNHCFRDIEQRRCDTSEYSNDLFTGEEYVNVWFDYVNGTPLVNVAGQNDKSAQYMLCGNTLLPVGRTGEIICESR